MFFNRNITLLVFLRFFAGIPYFDRAKVGLKIIEFMQKSLFWKVLGYGWFSLSLLLNPLAGFSQAAVWSEPLFPRPWEPVTVYFDARFGNGGLKDCNCTVYLHTGVITNFSTQPSDWKYVSTQWGVANPAWAMTPVEGRTNLYKVEIKPDIRSYYRVPGSEDIRKMAFVFRNANGSKEGKDTGNKDFFLDVFAQTGLVTSMNPAEGSNLVLSLGNTIPFNGRSSDTATLTLLDNGTVLRQLRGVQLDYTIGVVASGNHKVEFIAETATERQVKSFSYVVAVNKAPVDPPPGTVPGFTRLSPNSARFALFAPNKQAVFLTGSFNDWGISDTFLMNRSTDGNLHWLDVSGLTEGQSHFYQYIIEGGRRIGDPYSEMVLDPSNDKWISAQTFPDLPVYPLGKASGVVTWVRPKTAYPWKVPNFQKPEKSRLQIYELLVRDFVGRHDYQTLTDTLEYLRRLGVNAIELMPVNEFEGNESWGYNPSYHMALDKYYGPPEKLKAFIDACHQRGIAVILDVVFNHAFDQSPFCQLYWDEENRRPAINNPWLNPTPRHDFNVGHDFNHESQATRAFVKRVLRYWQEEFKFDGYRFDLSKGLTQTFTLGNPSAMAQRDPARIAILKDYADHVWAYDPNAYVIMEHFANNDEETELVNMGMMVWGNLNHEFLEAAMGYTNNLSGLDYRNRGWSSPGAILYAESHDEERMMYKNNNFGNQSPDGSYRVRDLATGLARSELAVVFLYGVPGPRMLWQFGELGYDFSINTCPDLTIVPGCRTANKPIRWDYRQVPARQRLYDVTRAMLGLRNNYPVFHTTTFQTSLSNATQKTVVLRHAEFDAGIAGNFGMVPATISINFGGSGYVYEYFSGDSVLLASGSVSLSYLPGQYRLFTTKRLPPPVFGGLVTGSRAPRKDEYPLTLFPNPVEGQLFVRYSLPQSGQYHCAISDLTGRRIKSVFSGQYTSGEHHFTLDTSGLPAGTYLLRLQGETGYAIQRFVVGR